MSSKSEIIVGLMQSVAPKIAVVFNATVPVLIGTLDTMPESAASVETSVFGMLLAKRFSAEYVSIAAPVGAPNGGKCVIAHG